MILKKKLRYLLVLTSEEIDASSSGNSITAEMTKVMGELHYSQANPRIAAQYTRRTFIVQVNRSYEKQTALALAFVKKLNGRKMGFYTIKTSGSIKTLIPYSKQLGA